ncbi:MAG: GNAT family N-acetyltransferase [Nonomuraea sp.]|nr:GNAT family N-acetyltransferase [Nonomuraea sp.]NUP61179.1 GNAT family N-acetyltransferase [Nonomuraea sp.]NUP79279.1 GNAT family N-acetyltransferase [Nonomuraea sp.]NUS07267.1 GNAT family N-acetyltransferase [Nonomuraea sp.]
MTAAFVRPYRPADLEAVYDICVRTADAGGDARGRYASDLLMGDIFAAPYVTLEPEHAHVVDDGAGRAVGYIVGTADTAAFVRRYREEWIPQAAERCPEPADPPVTADDMMLALHYRPERMIVPELAGHPAHLHIDLLPGRQRGGWGRRLMGAFVDGLRAAGVPRLHLGMLSTNVAARAFYDRLGFEELKVAGAGPVTYLGRDTSPIG